MNKNKNIHQFKTPPPVGLFGPGNITVGVCVSVCENKGYMLVTPLCFSRLQLLLPDLFIFRLALFNGWATNHGFWLELRMCIVVHVVSTFISLCH